MADEKSLVVRLQLQKDKLNNGSLATRLAQRLHQKSQCLLLDTSGSMEEDCGDGRSKLAVLKVMARNFSETRTFCFNDDCEETAPRRAIGMTNMAGAFSTIKAAGMTHAVLITDGQPDSAEAALDAAAGLTIDIIYVGPMPAPPFLAHLAARTGGTYGATSLSQQQQVTQHVRLLLTHKGN